MEIKKNTLVLVERNGLGRALALVQECQESSFVVNIIYPLKRDIGVPHCPGKILMAIAQDINREDINDKVASIILRLAEGEYGAQLMQNAGDVMLDMLGRRSRVH